MSVKASNSLGGIRGSKIGVHPGGKFRPLGFARRKIADRSERFTIEVAGRKGVQDFVDAGNGVRHFGPANGERLRHEKPFP